jgi:aminoglycoside phosphotransferase (APT) family kinase protein
MKRKEDDMDSTVDLTVVEVQRRLQGFYRSDEAEGGGSRVSEVTLLGSGFETDVFAFSLAAAGGGSEEGQDLVLRVYAGEGASDKSAREFAAMGRLREAGYPVPRVLALQRDPWPLGRPFVIMERIHGVSLGATYWAAPEDRRLEIHTVLYRLMVALHTLEGSAILPDSPLAHARDPYCFIDHEISTLSELLGRLEGREPPSLRDALAWLISRRSTVPCERLAVVHGDFHPNNVLLRADGAPFVIDWSNVRLGDYRTDIAWTRLITQAEAQPEGGVHELRLYEQQAGEAISRLEYFEAVACIRLLLSVLISLQFGAARQGMRPGAEVLMRRDPAHTRYVAALLQKRTGIAMPDLDSALSALFG